MAVISPPFITPDISWRMVVGLEVAEPEVTVMLAKETVRGWGGEGGIGVWGGEMGEGGVWVMFGGLPE